MKVTFVRPNLAAMRSTDAMQPLVFSILKGLTPPEHETVLYDERLEDIPVDEPTDLVAMTVETYTARRAYQLARAFRRRGVPVVMGGYHPTLATDEVLPHADAVVVGDAEKTWPRVLEDAARGRLQRIYRESIAPSQGRSSLAGVHYDRTIFQGKRYNPFALVQYQRGCRYACDSVSIRAFYGSTTRVRPVADMVQEIASLPTRRFFFADDNLFSHREAALELFEALVPLDVRWGSQITIDVARDEAQLDLMQRSGCRAVLIGFESLDPDSLREMKKGWNLRSGGYDDCIRKLRARGIMIYATFVFGYDHDTVASFDVSLEFARRHGFFLANFNPLTPTPATALYDRLKREGRLIDDPWWLSSRFRYGTAAFHPVGMTAAELTAGVYRARRKFYGLGSIARRALDFRANARDVHNLSLFVGANLISRREIVRKQGQGLGSAPEDSDLGAAAAAEGR